MKQKKIRRHKRIWKAIENWRLGNLDLNLTGYLLTQEDRYYAKIRVHPWNRLSLTNSVTPEPRGMTKQKILSGLIDIYEDWKNQLDKLGQPYYLKIWLFEPRFSKSQVVCAIGNSIAFYENTFFEPEVKRKLIPANYGKLKDRLEKLNWDYRLDEDHYDNTEVGEPEIYASRQDYEDAKKWFEKLLKKPHRTYQLKVPIGERTESYSFKRGDLWLGGQK
ncbi:MAG: hypothetical protein IPN95_08900 [Bacteroidetes bacterium]|nr:hypothetical protein [Bacteroidota bacterium]MBL0018187.1 hypothetical protein [Bacteroidota bacterium]MBP6640222.1 hypothetical protein [Bacteroidia bacterium]MBP6720980.1 hypothetical protein [Bacteroidia bacterium]MBP8073278.1 hypothetical protein [Bacteroidia bacterium]